MKASDTNRAAAPEERYRAFTPLSPKDPNVPMQPILPRSVPRCGDENEISSKSHQNRLNSRKSEPLDSTQVLAQELNGGPPSVHTPVDRRGHVFPPSLGRTQHRATSTSNPASAASDTALGVSAAQGPNGAPWEQSGILRPSTATFSGPIYSPSSGPYPNSANQATPYPPLPSARMYSGSFGDSNTPIIGDRVAFAQEQDSSKERLKVAHPRNTQCM